MNFTFKKSPAEIAEIEKVSKKSQEKHIRLAQEKIEKDTNYEVLRNSTTHTKMIMLAVLKSRNGARKYMKYTEIYVDVLSKNH